MGVTLKCYDVEKINENEAEYFQRLKDDTFGFHKGHKFDSEGHSWIFLREYITLSYSYMTFAINAKMQQLSSFKNEDFLFDKEQYNFIISKSTFLHDEDLINNPVQLLYILKNFEELDPVLLDQIQYYYTKEDEDSGKVKRVTPLHIAHEQQNNKSINILLKFMSILDYSQFSTFRDLWPQLLDYDGFIDFINEQTFQTI